MVMGGAVTGSATGGWDGGWDKQLGNWTGMAGLTYTSDDKGTRAWANGTYGGTSEHSSQAWSMYSLVLTHNITDKTHLMLQHDHGYANSILLGGVSTDTEWYGVNMHLTYDIKDNLTAGLRGEWFRDQNGFRVCSPGRVAFATNGAGNSYAIGGQANNSTCNAASYYAVTAGMNWKPMKWLNIRPNVRYDWADGRVAAGGQYRPFGNAKQDQFLFSTDFTVNF
jgi:hypothetical protein